MCNIRITYWNFVEDGLYQNYLLMHSQKPCYYVLLIWCTAAGGCCVH